MATHRDRLQWLRQRARRVHQPSEHDVANPDATVTWATRALLRAESAEDVAGIVAEVVDQLGGRVVPAHTDDPDALPLDVSFGVSEPMLPTADPGSPAGIALARHLPTLVADARAAIDTIQRTAHLSATVARDPDTGLETRATFARELGRMTTDDAVLVVRITVPEAPDGTDDHLHAAMTTFATHLHDQLASEDHAARLEEDEFGVLLHRPGSAGTQVVVTRLRRDWERLHPQVLVHVGAATFETTGPDALRASYDALDRDLDAHDQRGGDLADGDMPERSTP